MHLLLCIERKVSTLSRGAMARLLAHRVFDLGFGLLDLSLTLPLRLSATAARIRSFKAASSILSPSWMSMARLTFPSRLELNKPEGSFNETPLANVILTTFLYVSPVQTMPPWRRREFPSTSTLRRSQRLPRV